MRVAREAPWKFVTGSCDGPLSNFASSARDTESRTREVTDSRTRVVLPPLVLSTTTFGPTLVAVRTYGTIPPDLTQFQTSAVPTPLPPSVTTQPPQFNSFGVLNDKDTLPLISNVLTTLNTTHPPFSVTLSAGSPELGSFIAVANAIPGAVTYVVSPGGENITFTSANTTALSEAVANGFVFSPSEEARARNMTGDGLYIRVEAKDNATQIGAVALQMNKLVINEGPSTLYVDGRALVLRVQRGYRFDLALGRVFVHRQGLPMQFAVSDVDGFPIPATMLFACAFFGNCTAKGELDTSQTLRVLVQASDGFILRAGYVTFVPFQIPIHPSNASFPAPLLRPGARFQYALPTSLFESSTRITYTRVTRADGFPLPAGTVVFEPPFLLRGEWPTPGLLALRLQAEDLFFESARNFTLNFTNARPACRAMNASLLKPVAALREFERTVELSSECSDADGDAVAFTAVVSSMPSWLRADITPGGATAQNQKLVLTGSAPASAEGKDFVVNVTVREFFDAASTVAELATLQVTVRVVRNTIPLLYEALPNVSVVAGDSARETVLVLDHFADPQGDDLSPTVAMRPDTTVGWVTLTVYGAPPSPSFNLYAGPGEDTEEMVVPVDVFVTDSLGARSATHTMYVTVVRTTWQKIQDYVYLSAGLISLALTAVGSLWWFPFLVNCVRRNSKIIPCPVSAQHPVHQIPLDTIKCMFSVRRTGLVARLLCWLPGFAYDELTLGDTFDGAPPIWGELAEFKLTLKPPSPDFESRLPVVTFRCFSASGFLLEQFDVDYAEASKGWVFDADAAAIAAPSAAAGLAQPLLPPRTGDAQIDMLQTEMHEMRHRFEQRIEQTNAASQGQVEQLRHANEHQRQEIGDLRSVIERMLRGERVGASPLAPAVQVAAAAAAPPFPQPPRRAAPAFSDDDFDDYAPTTFTPAPSLVAAPPAAQVVDQGDWL